MNTTKTYEIQNDKLIRSRLGELPECPSINMETGKIEYLDPNDENVDWQHYMPLADLYI